MQTIQCADGPLGLSRYGQRLRDSRRSPNRRVRLPERNTPPVPPASASPTLLPFNTSARKPSFMGPPHRPHRPRNHPRRLRLLDCLTCKPTGHWSSRPSGSRPRPCWTPVGAASTNACTATASNPPFAQLTALARPHTPAKAKTQPTKNPPQQAKTTKKPPRRPHTTNEPWSLHDQGSHKTIVAVAAGFEPAVAINHTAFRVLHLRPLGHATADYRSGITPHSATRQPVGRDTSPGCASITEPMPRSTRPKHAPSRRAAHSPHAADVVPVFRASPSRRRPACAKPSR